MLATSKPRLIVVRSGLCCELVDLKGLAASRKAVSQEIPKGAASVFFCHGTPEALLGHHESILDAGNANLTAERIVVAIACSPARTLGIAAVLEGADSLVSVKFLCGVRISQRSSEKPLPPVYAKLPKGRR
jgi:hypothetical protein